nr:MAG TPA: hypothetical protein [Caudoviricetes sp.]
MTILYNRCCLAILIHLLIKTCFNFTPILTRSQHILFIVR